MSRRTTRRGPIGPNRRARAGMTLIEVMIAVLIIAVASTGIAMGVGALGRTKLRSAAMKILAASRFAYTRATNRGVTVRIVLDATTGQLSLEEGSSRVTLARADDERFENDENADGSDRAGVDPWAAARSRLDDAIKPTFGASPFSAIKGTEGELLKRFQPQALGDGIRIQRMFLAHEPEPRTEGRGAIYYFPGGFAERATIQLADRQDRVYTVDIHPLTGRATARSGAFEPREIRDGDDASEVEDGL